MLGAKEVLSLTEVASPVLTAYIGTGPTMRGKEAASTAWLKQEAKAIAKDLPPGEQESFEKQLSRTRQFLADRKPKEKGMVILAGPSAWKLLPVPFKVENELHWGKPALAQLLNFVEEENPCLIVAIDRAGARFFRYTHEEMSEYEESKFHIDPSQWKKKEHTHMARRATRMPHGNQRDVFRQRMDAQYLHVCRAVAKRAAALSKANALSPMFLVGSKRLTELIEAALPQKVRENVTLVAEDLARVPVGTLQEHVSSRITAQAEEAALGRVAQLTEGVRGTITGFDEILAQLQNGRMGKLMMARGFERSLKRCAQCGLADSSADPVCRACGGKREAVKLSEVLPELLRTHRTEMQVVNGAAAERLRKLGGMGGWSRQANGKK